MKTKLSASPELLLAFRVGAIGGAICGIIILLFASLTGHSGTTGSEYIGAWDWSVLGLGIMYGSVFGILMVPLGYIIFLRKIGLKKAILPAFLGTIIGGLFGITIGHFEALIYGCIGFFSALIGLSFSAYLRDKSKAPEETGPKKSRKTKRKAKRR